MLLDCKKLKEEIFDDLKIKLKKINKTLTLSVIEIGNNDSNKIYLKQKEKMCEELGYNFNHIKLEDNIKEERIIDIIKTLNNNDEIDGILLQLPIPKHLDYKKLKNIINPLKDIDGLNEINQNKLIKGETSLIPCTALGIIKLLDYYNINFKDKNVVIIGRSDIVGKPLYNILCKETKVTLCHSKTEDIKKYTKEADILIVAIGKANFITEEYIKKGVIIIDVGINRLNNKICGDVDYLSVKDKVSYITPVPNGVGKLTIAMLAYNLYESYKMKVGGNL